MELELKIFAGILGVLIALLQTIAIRSFMKNLIITAFISSIIAGYHFYLQPFFENLPLLPEALLVGWGTYLISKGIFIAGRFFGFIPI